MAPKLFPHQARLIAALFAILAAGAGLAPANAATATFGGTAPVDEADAAALSDGTDGDGATVGLNESLMILLSTPIASEKHTGSLSIFTLAPETGDARALIRIGSYNGGDPVIVFSRFVNAGNTLTVDNLFQRGCSAFGGCDFIEIITVRARGGAEGVEIDYVNIDGEVVVVSAPTPEPSVWALMICGFAMVGARLKMLRRRERLSPQPRLSFRGALASI